VIAWLKNRRDRQRTARKLYGSIVTQARQPTFYAAWGIPDTAQGRFEMIALHLTLALQRLSQEGRGGRQLARSLTESFVVDMDDAMREMTFSDLAVPREIKRAAAALYDRHAAYLAACAPTAGPDALPAALLGALAYLGANERIDANTLAGYIRRALSTLQASPSTHILTGELRWPPSGAMQPPVDPTR
jgi:cytochrome b pre-mRNA-processing protein 3